MHFNLEFFLTLATLICGLMLLAQHYMRSKRGLFYSFVETVGSLFLVFLIVLIIRSFIIEPFRIPSGSMLPTLEIGDFVVVNKFQYGLRIPVLRNKFLELGAPERGDVVVFKYPRNPKHDFIKRVIGLPGDHIIYQDKTIYVNGTPMLQTLLSEAPGYLQKKYMEDLMGMSHGILLQDNRAGSGADWEVPANHYFVMGDNRDNSNDSRGWGFVPESHLVGRAFLIWLHWDWNSGSMDISRIGTSIQ